MLVAFNQGGYYGVPRRVARERAERYLKKLSLWDKAFAPSRQLSGGMKRRLMIVPQRCVHGPIRLLILDEPLPPQAAARCRLRAPAGVDIEIRRSMWRFISSARCPQGGQEHRTLNAPG